MDEEWERAVEAALRGGGAASSSSPEGSSASTSSPPRSLTLDGAIKCLHGRLPSPEILERFQSLEHLSIANIGLSSLERFPRLRSLTRLILSDNRISSGLEHLVESGLDSLRDLDLSNNRIGSVEDLAPLARLRLVSLDLYECPVAKVKDCRSRVFGLIRSLKYLDKMDADENERPESDEEEDDYEEEGEDEEEDDEEDPGSGEVDGDDMYNESDVHLANGNGVLDGGVILNGDEDESEAEEEMDNGVAPEVANGFRIVPARPEEVDIDESDDEENLGEEIDEDEEEEEEDVVEVHDVSDDEDDEDDVEDDDEEDDDGDGEEMDDGEEGGEEIDGHERGEEDEDEDGELGEEEDREGLMLRQGFEEVEDHGAYDEENAEDDDEDDDTGTEYVVQISQPPDEIGGSDFDTNEIEDEEELEEDELDQIDAHPGTGQPEPSTSQISKRKRDDDHDDDDGSDGDDDVDHLRSVRFRH